MRTIATLLLAISASLVFAQLPERLARPECSNRLAHEFARNGNFQAAADSTLSDSIDILDTRIKLDITDLTTDTIRGGATIRFTALLSNITVLPLDLLHMTIDSVVMNNTQLTYNYTDTLLSINLGTAMNPGDTNDISIWYHGRPQMDPSGWGGFYFQSGYAYNLGVGFGSIPHSFGRAFHPCFDNFVERSSYTYIIGTNNGKVSYCNGMLTTDTTDANGVRWRTWTLNETIPSYLANVSVAAYTQVNWSHTGPNGTIPVLLTALPADTTAMKNSFLHLEDAIDAHEANYGPHAWPRIGFCLVPFNSGAMEHATNISYPRLAANGSLTYETLFAHELSHHWWGDQATCHDAGDMWMNEGWATYSEHLFTEWVYGAQAYRDVTRDNHDDVIHFVHLREGGYRPLYNMPQQYTYGDHVYLKGADVAHTLRGYLGDSLFFAGIQYHLAQNMYDHTSSYEFRDNLIAATGQAYLMDFFNDWVFNGGWPHFSIDSIQSVPNGPNYDVTVYVRQKLIGAPNYFTNVPLEFSFYDISWHPHPQRIFISGQYSNFTVTLPFDPAMVAIDINGKISDGITDQDTMILNTGIINLTAARCTLNVSSVIDSAYVRVEHNWAAPDSIKNNTNNYRISSKHYWTVDGFFAPGFRTKGKFYYDGRTSSMNGPGMYLDNDLTIPNGDSIILLYRRNAADDWQEWPVYTKFIIGSAGTSKYGYVDADSLQPGQYAFANGVSAVLIGTTELPAPAPELSVYPNPADEQLTIEWPDMNGTAANLRVYQSDGRLVYEQSQNANKVQLQTSGWSGGFYIVELTPAGSAPVRKELVIMRR